MIHSITRWAALVRRYAQAADHVVGMNRRNADFVYRYNSRKHYPLVDDKIECKRLMAEKGVPMAETLDICEGLFDVERVITGLIGQSEFVLKPSNGSGGKGILVLGKYAPPASADELPSWALPGDRACSGYELQSHLANIVFGAFGRRMSDRALVERKITPHSYLRDLWSDGVCDLRIIVMQGRPIMAMLRVPTQRSQGKANLHQGGIGVAVDVETGRTWRASSMGCSIVTHPETGRSLIGAQLPAWSRVLEVAQLAASSVPLGYLGVDLVVNDAAEPLVLELNARPGLEIQNVNARSIGEHSLAEPCQ
jgi:alpha-L-glutamate ligase-like protein